MYLGIAGFSAEIDRNLLVAAAKASCNTLSAITERADDLVLASTSWKGLQTCLKISPRIL